MARKTITVSIQSDGRDKGKTFVITEMAATASLWWATRAFFGLARGGVNVPADLQAAGFAALAEVGTDALAKLEPTLVWELLTELIACVQIIPDPGRNPIARKLVEEDTEEPKTLLHLAAEAFAMHTGFMPADVLSFLGTSAAAKPPA